MAGLEQCPWSEEAGHWIHGCRYVCPKCDREFLCHTNLNRHLTETHHQEPPNPHNTWRHRFRHSTFYCSICQKGMMHHCSYIYDHMTHLHQLTLAQYTGEHVEPGEATEPSLPTGSYQIRLDEESSSSRCGSGLGDNSGTDQDTLPGNLEQGSPGEPVASTSQDQVASTSLKTRLVGSDRDPDDSDSSMVDSDGSRPTVAPKVNSDQPHWTRGCVYKCESCEQRFDSVASLQHHARARHKQKYVQASKRRVQTSHHQCLICQKPIVQEYSYLYDHFAKTHNLTLADYEERHLGQSAPGASTSSKGGAAERLTVSIQNAVPLIQDVFTRGKGAKRKYRGGKPEPDTSAAPPTSSSSDTFPTVKETEKISRRLSTSQSVSDSDQPARSPSIEDSEPVPSTSRGEQPARTYMKPSDFLTPRPSGSQDPGDKRFALCLQCLASGSSVKVENETILAEHLTVAHHMSLEEYDKKFDI